jgi:hypothetical protein
MKSGIRNTLFFNRITIILPEKVYGWFRISGILYYTVHYSPQYCTVRYPVLTLSLVSAANSSWNLSLENLPRKYSWIFTSFPSRSSWYCRRYLGRTHSNHYLCTRDTGTGRQLQRQIFIRAFFVYFKPNLLAKFYSHI